MIIDIQNRIWEIVESANDGDKLSSAFDIFILTLIVLNVVAVILGSVQTIHDKFGEQLKWFEVISVSIFTLEYLMRIWSCVSIGENSNIRTRLNLMRKPMSVIDVLAILPFYIPFVGIDLRAFRALRLLRIVRLAKIGRYYSSLNLIIKVLRAKKEEMVLTIAMIMLLVIVSSSLLYYCENPAQPESFSSIPATMWWAVATITTVGYGDIYPITMLGKVCAAVIAMLGIGMVALPTGILGSGFVEELQNTRRSNCPHCGFEIN